jgi:hypothetical protein
MADQQGTGKHAHKSAAEPYEHHEAPSTKGADHKSESHSASATSHSSGSHTSSSSSSHSGEQGTGKHPHKSASDPKEHHEGAKASK